MEQIFEIENLLRQVRATSIINRENDNDYTS